MAEGRELILDLEKNEQLFAPSYTETHYTSSGNPQTTTLKLEVSSGQQMSIQQLSSPSTTPRTSGDA